MTSPRLPDSSHHRAPGDEIAIAAESVSRRFGDSLAVDGLDLQVRRGEIYGFLGPNGAGKSTTMRILCTLLAPTSGRASVCGHDVVEEPDAVRSRIGVALQDVALDPKQTGTELLRMQARLYGLNRAETEQRLRQLGEIVDIGDALDRMIDTYSGGMKRRLDLAAALVHNPDVLFLDEPTTGLDPVSRVRVWDEVRRLNLELGMTIFLTTQYLEEADSLADRVGIIDGGRLVAEGTPGELKRRVGQDVVVARISSDASVAVRAVRELPEVQSAELRGDELVISMASGCKGASTIGPIAIALDNAAVEVTDLTLRTPTLDDVFLELTGMRISSAESDARDSASSDDPSLIDLDTLETVQ
jgi:ABC-2 type transport system ATP-binding protein